MARPGSSCDDAGRKVQPQESQMPVRRPVAAAIYGVDLGSGLIDQSPKMMVAAMQMADMNVWEHRS
jgi:hypothetical protein